MMPDRPPRRGRPILEGAVVLAVAAIAIGGNTRLEAPPRFDGAGYAVLGQALMTGRGYREVDHPDRPPHAHYPPGYPLALAALWRLTGRSVAAAHGFSWACTSAAVLAAWWWLRGFYPPRVAFLLGIALASNWAWGRMGGEIQSEPLYVLLGQLALLVSAWAGRRGGVERGLALGLVLASCMLTRHVGVGLALAIGLDLLIRGRSATVLAAGLAAIAPLLPWVAWLAMVRDNTQVGLLTRGSPGDRIAGNGLFYLRRLPDLVTGPFVEIATVFRRSPRVAALATAWAALATGLLLWGWARAARAPRRRLAGLVPLLTLAILLIWPFTEAGRFLIPLVPFLLVGATEGLGRLAALAGLRRPRTWAAAAIAAASIPYSAYSIAADRAGAQRAGQADFDAACAWIAGRGSLDGPILTRQPGEVYWLTGRQALAPPGDDPEAIGRLIDRRGVAYLLVDDERYAHAPPSPLRRFVASRPGRVVRVWGSEGGGPVAVYAVQRAGPSKTSRP